MTNELEKQFFDTFGIEPKKVRICTNAGNCPKKYKICNDTCKHWQIIREDYPQITDRILLELICIVYKAKNSLNSEIDIFELNVENLKNTTLKRLIWINNTYKNERIKQQVQALFKEVK